MPAPGIIDVSGSGIPLPELPSFPLGSALEQATKMQAKPIVLSADFGVIKGISRSERSASCIQSKPLAAVKTAHPDRDPAHGAERQPGG